MEFSVYTTVLLSVGTDLQRRGRGLKQPAML
jgi:hypothetical protein